MEPVPIVDAPAWHIADAERTMGRPRLPQGLSIDKYAPSDLAHLVRHVRSDGVLRTQDEELLILMRELGFAKRGSRIVAALRSAQDAVR